jgi:Ribose/Galactose Isomerase
MRIAIAADHGGSGLKEDLRGRLIAAGYEFVDFGENLLEQGDDYPDFISPLADRGPRAPWRGVAVCGSGAGLQCAPTDTPVGKNRSRHPNHPGVAAEEQKLTICPGDSYEYRNSSR